MPTFSRDAASSTFVPSTVTLTPQDVSGGSPVNSPIPDGDIGYALAICDASVTLSSASGGWTLRASGTVGGDRWYLHRLDAGASEPSTYTWTFSGGNVDKFVELFSVAGAISVIEGTAGTATGNTCTAPSITIPAGGLLLCLFAGDKASGAGGPVWTGPTGFNNRQTSGNPNGTRSFKPDLPNGIAAPSAGATGNQTATISGGDAGGDNVGVQIFFAGAAAPSGWTVGAIRIA